jgi:heat shock protein HspQ
MDLLDGIIITGGDFDVDPEYYSDEEKICKGCYMKVREYIKATFYCKFCNKVELKNHNCAYAALSNRSSEKKFIFNEMFETICDLESKYNLPVAYSYAITVYKSQGSTYENVIIDYDNIYMCNRTSTKNLTRAMYVGVSRVQKRLWFLNYSYNK